MKNSWLHMTWACLALIPMACGAKGEKTLEANTSAPKPVPIRVAPLTKRTVERTVEVVGTLKGWDDVTIGAKRAGRVSRISHDMGDRVKPGEKLVELETIDTDLEIDQAQKRLEADLAKLGLKDLPKGTFDVSSVPSVVQMRVALERARLNLSRERNLMAKGAGTTQDFQNADNDEKSASASLENATLTAQSTLASAIASKVALDVAKQARVDLTLLAPSVSNPPEGLKVAPTFAITKRSVSEGQMVKVGDPICELTIENPLRLWCNVPERYSNSVELGQDVRIKVASFAKQTFIGKVRRINPSVDPVSRTFQVEASVPNDDLRLRPGGFAKVSIVTKRTEQTVTVPRESVYQFAGVTKLYLVEGGKVRAVNVETGIEGEGWMEVIGELPPDGQVATEGFSQLADGTPIILKTDDRTPEPAKGEAPAPTKEAKKA